MNLVKTLLTVLVLTLLSSSVYSQHSLGGSVNYLNLFGGSEIKSFGLGLRYEYATTDRISITGSLNYYLPNKTEGQTFVEAIEPQVGVPFTVLVDTEETVPFIHLRFGGKRYFIGYNDDDYGVYATAEAGFLMAPYKDKVVGDYDSSVYRAPEDYKEFLSNFTINFGIGGEKSFDFGYLFGEAKLNLPANNVGGAVVEFDIPASLSLHLGLRVEL